MTSSGGQELPADSRKSYSQKKKDDEDTGNETEWRNGLDGEWQAGAVGVTCGLYKRGNFIRLCTSDQVIEICAPEFTWQYGLPFYNTIVYLFIILKR